MPLEANMPQPSPPPNGLTLVLGGGGFKGVAHVGALRVLQAEGLVVERVVGCSAGALMGSAYCYLRDAEALHALVMRFLTSEGLRRHGLVALRRMPGRQSLLGRLMAGIRRQVALERISRRSSALGGGALRFIVRSLVPKTSIESLPIPLSIGVLDLTAGEVRLLTHGDLCLAVTASSAVPGFFPPIEWGRSLLCDPGLADNLPTALLSSDFSGRVVAIDLSGGLSPYRASGSGMDVMLRAQEVSTHLANRAAARRADVIIRPELGGRHWLDTRNLEDVMEAGAAAARAALPALRSLVSGGTSHGSGQGSGSRAAG